MKNEYLSEHIISKRSQIETAWNQLKQKSAERRKLLDANYKMQKFLTDYRDIISWIELMKTVINSEDLAKDVAGAEILLERHQEHKGEIDAREDSFQTTETEGKLLIEQKISPEEVKLFNIFKYYYFYYISPIHFIGFGKAQSIK